MAAQDYVSVVQQLYISYFGRPADTYGLKNYTERLEALKAPTDFAVLNQMVQADKAGTSELSKLVNSFNTSPEAIALYGNDNSNLGISKFLVAVFENVLGRTPELGPGWDFWFNALASGSLRRADAAMAITEGALSNTTPQGLIDAALVQKKNAVSVAFTNALDTPAKINAYSTQAAIDIAVGLLEGVTATTDVAAYQPNIVAAVDSVVVSNIPVVTKDLGTGIDTLPGTVGNDIFNAVIDGDNSTLNALDSVNGAGGNDVLNLDVIDGASAAGANPLTALPSVTVSNVETVSVRSTVDLTANFSSWTGLTAAKVTQAAGDVTVTAGSTTALSVTGAEQDVTLKGGASQSVVTSGGAVTLGGATGNTTGAIVVTHSAQADAINVDGGSTVAINATADVSSGAIIVGANKAATGAVAVTQNITSDGSGATAGNISVTGGSTVTINANLTNTAVEGGGNTAITAGTYTVVSGGATTAVTVKQTAVANDFAGGTTGATKETSVVTFGALKAGEKVAISAGTLTGYNTDLTFTAAKDLTAAEVAAAFAGLTTADKQAPGGWVVNGTFTGTLDSGWTSGVASNGKVTFTAASTGNVAGASELTVTTNAAVGASNFTAVATDGSAGTTVTGVDVTADFGNVVVNESATAPASITTVTLNGYDGATLGAANALDKLATLNLTKGSGTTGVTSAATTVAVALDGMKAGSALTFGGTVATLNITASGAASDLDITAAGAKTVGITAGVNLDLSGAPLAVETLTIAGAGNVTMGDISATVKTITAGTATGKISATVDGGVATVTTGSGNDSITVDTAGISKAISLGAGDDTLTLSAAGAATVPTAAVAGGAGEDTIKMNSASAQALDGNTNFKSAITGFERLNISDTIDVTAGNVTIDLENLGFSYVTLSAGPSGGPNAAILDKMANNGTLALVAAPLNSATVQVNITDAATGTADKLNLSITGEATIAAGTVTANNVETIAIKSTDTFLDNGSGSDTNNAVHTLTLAADAVTSIVVTGDDLSLDTNSTALVTVDASALLGGIVYTADGKTSGTTVLGGAGVDNLTSSGENDILKGNAGKDIFTVKDLAQIYGGTGADTFNFLVNTNLTKVSTVRDAEALDVFALKDVYNAGGAAAVVTKFYGSGAEYNPNTTTDVAGKVNAALAQTGEGEASWFQHNGNTYIVIDANDGADVAAGAVDAYIQGQDIVIEIIGAWDLSKASFNATSGTLELG